MALFLSICSSTKAGGGSPDYDEGTTLAASLSAKLADALLDRRRQALQLVRDGDFQSHDVRVSEHAHNRELRAGRDFGGRRNAAYLPAVQRYRGRFFQTLGQDGAQALVDSSHETLFLSGLYGLLRPLEPIQLYSCPLEPEIARLWGQDDLLTDALREFSSRKPIARIVDLTAVDAYRNLLDWRRIEEDGLEVLHAFHPDYKGDSQLIAFAAAFKDPLLGMSEDRLIDLGPEASVGEISLRLTSAIPADIPPEYRRLEAARRERELVQTFPAGMVDYVVRGGNPKRPDAEQDGNWRFSMALQFIADLNAHRAQRDRISGALSDLLQHPTTRSGNTVRPLTGDRAGEWRYRIGDYRLIYKPDREAGIVHLLGFGSRGGIYE